MIYLIFGSILAVAILVVAALLLIIHTRKMVNEVLDRIAEQSAYFFRTPSISLIAIHIICWCCMSIWHRL